MMLPQAVEALARDPEWIAARPRGVVIAMTAGHVIMRIGIPKPYRWAATYSDIIAADWIVGPLAQVRRQLGADDQAHA